jgi:orotate phosphoribosyltransferase
MAHDIHRLLPARAGHFLLESGHHGELWLDLELLCHDVAAAWEQADELARRLTEHGGEVVCAPLVEGAFIGLRVAQQLGLPFTYAQPETRTTATGLFPVTYRLPGPLRPKVRGRRILLVNDVINAGSAVGGTLLDLRECGARSVAIGTLAVLGTAASHLAREHGVPRVTRPERPNRIRTPAECPLCARGVPLSDVEPAREPGRE